MLLASLRMYREVLVCKKNKNDGKSVLDPSADKGKTQESNVTAEEHFKKANKARNQGDFETAITNYNEAIRLKPDYVFAFNDRGAVYYLQGEYEKAIADCDEAIRLNENHASAFNTRGLVRNELGSPKEAIADYSEAIRLNPNGADALSNRGNAYRELGDFKNSFADHNKAILLNPNHADAFCNRGYAYQGLGDFEKAIADYDEAVRLQSQHVAAFYNRGVAYQMLGNLEKAINNYNKTIQLNPNDAKAFCNRGITYQRLGNLEKAITDLNEAIRLNPDYADAFCGRGIVYNEQGEYEKAIAEYNEATRLEPNHVAAINNRGVSYHKKGNYKKAIIDFSEAQRLGLDVGYALNKAQKALESKSDESIQKIIQSIKEELEFKGDQITHYTSLTTARILLVEDDTRFRLSNTVHLNDPTEGVALLDFLTGKALGNQTFGATKTEFSHTPFFIGSFVTKSDDLTLWRMYGKEGHSEASGCSITLNPTFVKTEKDLPNQTLYNVAYLTGTGHIEGIENEKKKKLDPLLKELKDILKEKGREELLALDELNEIRYLFKHDHYRHEGECRIVVPKNPDSPSIHCDSKVAPPRTYIELGNAPIHHVKSITIGPKVERAEEWAAAFHIRFKKLGKKDAKVNISTLPFK